jgi:hypothetical protein
MRLGLIGKPRDPSGYEGILIGNGFVGRPMEPFLYRLGPSVLKLLVAYESRTHYQPRFDFYGIARPGIFASAWHERDGWR